VEYFGGNSGRQPDETHVGRHFSIMSKLARTIIALSVVVAFIGASRLPVRVGAQDATPIAVSPPQAMLPTNWGEVAGQTADVNGIKLYYESYGTGEPLILLHGGLGNGTYFANQIPVLAQTYQVIVVDSRGHGRSTFNDTPISYEVMSNDVLALMDTLGIAKANIVGWSDGGIIGLELAIEHPERLIKVVAFGANSDPTGVRLDVGSSPLFNAYIEQAYADYLSMSPAPERWDEFLANISNMWATEPNFSWDQLRSISVPVLILDGQGEEAIDLNQTKLMYLLIPGASLYLIPGTGHFAFIEKPDLFNQIVLDYLAGDLATPVPG
jgi:pimeloyl-ACP methyl ester carboxylesterase